MNEKKYKKSALRSTLESGMREHWQNTDLTVTPMDFSRMLKCYCDIFNLPDEIMRAKELPESFVDTFGTWLGYPLR